MVLLAKPLQESYLRGNDMNDLVQVVISNLKDVGIGVLLFIVAYAANMALSLYYNIKVLNEAFDKTKLFNSVLKIISFGIGTALLCIGVTTIPAFASHVGFEIPAEYSAVFQDLAILSVFIVSSCKYLLEAYQKFSAILKTSKASVE